METLLKSGLTSLGLPESGIPALLRYAELLLEKNKVMNLTSITVPRDVATLHFLDSIILLKLADFSGKTVADVGTGAGFPGLPLRIVEPSIRLTLLDSLGKRIAFLQEVCGALELRDVDCIHARAEDFAAQRRESFDIVTSRAVAALPQLAELCLPLVKIGGQFLAMKSVDSDGEIAEAEHAIGLLGGSLAAVQDYWIPQTDVCHRLVRIIKKGPTPAKYPRAFAKIKKSPL
jgi:16S rRNA (guanine527-N7)-methyltransferase